MPDTRKANNRWSGKSDVTRILAVEAVIRLGLGWYEQAKIIWALFYDLNNPLVVGQPVTVIITVTALCFDAQETTQISEMKRLKIELNS